MVSLDEIIINNEKKLVLKALKESSANFFITGNAGTGKSLLLEKLVSDYRQQEKNFAVVAPTGLAAINVGGQTIHSFFGFPPAILPEHAASKWHPQGRWDLLKNLEYLVIDEISMVRADLMDSMDLTLKKIKRSQEFFGGVQVIVLGDLYQLPPVLRSSESSLFYESYESPYFFSAECMRGGGVFERIELMENFRQKGDDSFLEILNNIRRGQALNESLELINAQVKDYIDNDIIGFVPTNKLADLINTAKLKEIESKEHIYEGSIVGKFTEGMVTAPLILRLKVGARVMLVKNIGGRFVNGLTGNVRKLSENSVVVEFDNGEEGELEQATWERHNYALEQGKVTQVYAGKFVQIPLKLAWANTIHKSQGLTFNEININWGNGAFAHGQAYVALSRCTNLRGLNLSNPLQAKDIIVDSVITDYLDAQ